MNAPRASAHRPGGAARAESLALSAAEPSPTARVLLLDALDSPGAYPADIAVRARALSACGTVTTCVVPTSSGALHAQSVAAARRMAADRIAQVRPDIVVIASCSAGGGDLARAVRAPATWWWPTGVGAALRRWSLWPLAGHSITTLPGGHAAAGRTVQIAGAEALDWAAHDAFERPYSRLPLWDGLYLVVPAPLGGDSGRALLQAFAELDARWDRVDLVVLADVQEEFQMHARALGVGARVHFAGPATADAELTWLRSAAGVALAPSGPVAASLVLRALACNVPLVVLGPLAAPVQGWLADRGALPGSWTAAKLPARVLLEDMLERNRAVESACARGLEVAQQHAAVALAARLKGALPEAYRRAA